jgi:hypothetical protein
VCHKCIDLEEKLERLLQRANLINDQVTIEQLRDLVETLKNIKDMLHPN